MRTRCELGDAQLAAAVSIVVGHHIDEAEIWAEEHGLTLWLVLGRRQEIHASLEHFAAADRLQLRHAQLAATVRVVVLHDIDEAEIRAKEDTLALWLLLRRFQEGHAGREHRAAAHRLQLLHADLTCAVLVVVDHDVDKAEVGAKEDTLALRSGSRFAGLQE